MTWAEILRSVVLAAGISGVVGLFGFWAASATARKIHKEKLDFDRELANEKLVADRELAERRVILEHRLAVAKRKAELAEQVLADFYKAKHAFEIIRSPMIWANEMVAEEGVAEDIVRNDGYGVMRRFREYTTFFAELEASRFAYVALFGAEAAQPYGDLIKVHNRVFHAAEAILQYRNQQEQAHLQEHLTSMRRVAFSNAVLDKAGNLLPDKIGQELEAIVAAVEATCRPALESALAAEAAGREA